MLDGTHTFLEASDDVGWESDNLSNDTGAVSGTLITLNGTVAGDKLPIGAISNGTASSISSPVSLTVCGKNFFDSINMPLTASNLTVTSITNGYRATNETASPIYFPDSNIGSIIYQINNLQPATAYTISFTRSGTGLIHADNRIRIMNSSGTTIGYATATALSFTVPSDGIIKMQYYVCAPNPIYYIGAGEYVEFSNIMLNIGSIASTFEAYNGTDYSIPIKDTAGTVLSLAPTESIALNLADGKWYIGATELHADTKTVLNSIVLKADLSNIFTSTGATLSILDIYEWLNFFIYSNAR